MPQIHAQLFSIYLRLLKHTGADPERLAACEDVQHVSMLRHLAVNSGSGSRSVQKTFEAELMDRRLEGRDPIEYCRDEVWA